MNTLPSLFQSTGLLYAPGIVILAFVLLLIPTLMTPGAKPEAATRAIASYMLKTVGLLLVGVSAVQVLYTLIAMKMLQASTLSALLLLMMVGLGIMIHESRVIAAIDEASVHVVRVVFVRTCEVIGAIIALMSALSLAMTFLITEQLTGWEMSATLLLLGLLLMLSSSVHIHAKYHRSAKKAAKKR